MPPKKKPTPPNGFMLFVMKRKKEEQERNSGKRYGHINEAIEEFKDEWEVMSEEERRPYVEKAKQKKEEMRQKPQSGSTDGAGATSNDYYDY